MTTIDDVLDRMETVEQLREVILLSDDPTVEFDLSSVERAYVQGVIDTLT